MSIWRSVQPTEIFKSTYRYTCIQRLLTFISTKIPNTLALILLLSEDYGKSFTTEKPLWSVAWNVNSKSTLVHGRRDFYKGYWANFQIRSWNNNVSFLAYFKKLKWAYAIMSCLRVLSALSLSSADKSSWLQFFLKIETLTLSND